MTPTQEQLTAALQLLTEIANERISQMGRFTKAAIGPQAQASVNILDQFIRDSLKPHDDLVVTTPS